MVHFQSIRRDERTPGAVGFSWRPASWAQVATATLQYQNLLIQDGPRTDHLNSDRKRLLNRQFRDCVSFNKRLLNRIEEETKHLEALRRIRVTL